MSQKRTRVARKHNEHRRDDEGEGDFIPRDVGTELDGLKACLNNDGDADEHWVVEQVGNT